MAYIGDNTADYLSIDGMETVRYEVARRSRPTDENDPMLRKQKDAPAVFDPARAPNANDLLAGLIAKRRTPAAAEKSPSGGVYLGYEANWWINTDQFPRGVIPKPGDVVVDADDERWTVLRWNSVAPTGNYKLGTVNLKLAHDLRDKINIERPQIEYDAAGSAIKRFPTGPGNPGGENLYANLPARVQLVSQEIDDERGIRGTKQIYDITVIHQVAVTNEDRVYLPWTGQYLEIRGLKNPERVDELPVLICEMVP